MRASASRSVEQQRGSPLLRPDFPGRQRGLGSPFLTGGQHSLTASAADRPD